MQREILTVQTPGRGLHDITDAVNAILAGLGSRIDMCQLFLQHTSASLVIQENADPDVLRDLETWFAGAVIDGDPRFRHRDEGPDDMSAHVRTALTTSALTIPVEAGRMMLGTWQGLYLYEHRTRAHRRRLVVSGWSLS